MTTSADAALAEALRLLTWPDRIALARDVDMGGADLARIVGVSRATVSRHAKRHGGLPDKRAERMRRLHADPEFAAAHAERMRRRHADPEFAAAHAERSAERMRRLNADGRIHSHIAGMTPEQRADYDTLRRNGYRKAEALAALGIAP